MLPINRIGNSHTWRLVGPHRQFQYFGTAFQAMRIGYLDKEPGGSPKHFFGYRIGKRMAGLSKIKASGVILVLTLVVIAVDSYIVAV
ncbi:MAG: hypothetical protein ACD_75C01367G0010 [uncultured bacterium]|nr:MAG: hypothetical protein ACD_75C01367G0010 [uncultured bacterium]